MPEKEKTYNYVIFSPEIIRQVDSALVEYLPKGHLNLSSQKLSIELISGEKWEHDNEDEFFADYRKGFSSAEFCKVYTVVDTKLRNFPVPKIFKGHVHLWIYRPRSGSPYTKVCIEMPARADMERVFENFEANVDRCRLPEQPISKSQQSRDWVQEIIKRIDAHCPDVSRKLGLALIKLNSEETEDLQNAAMLMRDAWIELAQWLCKLKNIDTTDIPGDKVVDRLKKLKLDIIDERVFNLARSSFNMSMKHHKRDIEIDTAVACVISSIVAIKTVIMEVLHAHSTG